jgi:hypothetical protein
MQNTTPAAATVIIPEKSPEYKTICDMAVRYIVALRKHKSQNSNTSRLDCCLEPGGAV